MYDVALYGHMTLDRIFDGFKKDLSVGSMGNVWKQLNKINPLLKIYLDPTDIGEALIFINKKKNERSSIANLNLQTKKADLKKSKCSHVMYLNELSDVKFIENIEYGIVTADLCRGKKFNNLQILKHIDFLFVSDEDLFMEPNCLSKMLKKGLILHHTTGSVYFDKQGLSTEINVKLIENVNVLGCGDMLVAGFLDYYLKRHNVVDCLNYSHDLISQTLKEQKKENENEKV
tara:strand:+ start:478 stop:1170 length:693 start_codon:yes stop_codon:yes gene_type:complete